MAASHGIFDYAFMRHAFAAGTAVAVVAGAVGFFMVLRGLSFAGHALSHVGFAGAAGAVAIGLTPVAGMLVFTVGAAGVMGGLGKRLYGRDIAIGVVLAWALGLGSLFLTIQKARADLAVTILFGEIFGISIADVVLTVIIGVTIVVLLLAAYRPLLAASIDEDAAEARGVAVRLCSVGYMLLLALAVSEAVQVVGVLLVFALLVAPPAIAQRLTNRPARALAISVVTALIFTWVGLLVAFYLPALRVSFVITTVAFVGYVLARGVDLLAGEQRA
jgi:zinc/manganese transport system permease protein